MIINRILKIFPYHDADSSQPVLYTYTTLSMRFTRSEPHSLMTLHPILVKLRRRQHYSIVSDSSFDYFKPTGDDFAKELISEIWSTSSKLLAFSRWHTVVVLMVYSRSFCHCFCDCIGVWNQSQRVCTRGDRLPHIGYKETRPNGWVGNAFCICLRQSQYIYWAPWLSDMEVTPRSVATYDLRFMIVGRKPLLLCANWCILTLPSYKPSA